MSTPPADDADEGLSAFLKELSRLQAAARAQAQELHHAHQLEERLQQQAKQTEAETQLARQAALRAELDLVSAQVAMTQAQEATAQAKTQLADLQARLEAAEVLMRDCVDAALPTSQISPSEDVSSTTTVTAQLLEVFDCVAQDSFLHQTYLQPLLSVVGDLQRTRSSPLCVGTRSVASSAKCHDHSAFVAYVRSLAVEDALTDEECAVLSALVEWSSLKAAAECQPAECS